MAAEAAGSDVAMLREQRRRREEFHGKTLAEFYKDHPHSAGLSKVVLTFETQGTPVDAPR